MKILLLEDDYIRVEHFRKRIDEMNYNYSDLAEKIELIHVETADDCISKLKEETFVLILLDHDLGGEVYVDTSNTNTGSEVARWINTNIPDISNKTAVITHSYNPDGAMNIKNLIRGCHHVPNIWFKNVWDKIIKINR